MSGDDINKAKGHPSSSFRNRSTVSRGFSSRPRRPPSGKYATAVKRRQMSAYALHTLEMVGSGEEALGGPRLLWDTIFAFVF